MKINFNKENISKFIKTALYGGSVLIVLVTGSQLYNAFGKKREKTYPKFKKVETFNERNNKQLTIDGLTYLAPEGYTLEVVNGNVHAVKKYYIIDKVKEYTDESGKTCYYVPKDYILVDDKIYREIVVYAEPIILNSKSL